MYNDIWVGILMPSLEKLINIRKSKMAAGNDEISLNHKLLIIMMMICVASLQKNLLVGRNESRIIPD